VDPDERDAILRTLVRIAASQDQINADLRTLARHQADVAEGHAARLARLDHFVERQDAINTGIQATLAEIKQIFIEMQRQRHNGRDA
jgi:hypothetical protein